MLVNPITELLQRLANFEEKAEVYFAQDGQTAQDQLAKDVTYYVPPQADNVLFIPPIESNADNEQDEIIHKKRKRSRKLDPPNKKRKTSNSTPEKEIDPIKLQEAAEELSKAIPPFRYTCCGCGQDHFISAQSMAAHAARCSKYQERNRAQKGPLKNTKQPVTKEWWDQHLTKMLKKRIKPLSPF